MPCDTEVEWTKIPLWISCFLQIVNTCKKKIRPTWRSSHTCGHKYTYWAKRLSNHFCMYNSVTSLSFLILLQSIITQCRLPILTILWGSSLSLSCCEGGYKKLAYFQVIKNGQILINLFGNVKVLPFLSKLYFESEKMSHWFLRYCQMKLVILTQKCIF